MFSNSSATFSVIFLLLNSYLPHFSSTIDDFTIMLVFLSRSQKEFKDSKLGCFKVMIGQMIGFSMVIFISLTASLFGLLISEKYMDLVGFFPLLIGLYKFWELCINADYTIDLSRFVRSADTVDATEFESKSLYDNLAEDEGDLSYEEDCKRTGSGSSVGSNNNSYHNPSILILAEKAYEYQDLQTVIYSGELGCGDSGIEVFDDEDDDDDESFLLAYEEKKKRSLLVTAVRNAFETCLDPFVLEVRGEDCNSILLKTDKYPEVFPTYE
jgi:hypothetical protein